MTSWLPALPHCALRDPVSVLCRGAGARFALLVACTHSAGRLARRPVPRHAAMRAVARSHTPTLRQNPYNHALVTNILDIMAAFFTPAARMRLVTLELAARLLEELVYYKGTGACLHAEHDAALTVGRPCVAVGADAVRAAVAPLMRLRRRTPADGIVPQSATVAG